MHTFPQTDKIYIYADSRIQKEILMKEMPKLWKFNNLNSHVTHHAKLSPVSNSLLSSIPLDTQLLNLKPGPLSCLPTKNAPRKSGFFLRKRPPPRNLSLNILSLYPQNFTSFFLSTTASNRGITNLQYHHELEKNFSHKIQFQSRLYFVQRIQTSQQ